MCARDNGDEPPLRVARCRFRAPAYGTPPDDLAAVRLSRRLEGSTLGQAERRLNFFFLVCSFFFESLSSVWSQSKNKCQWSAQIVSITIRPSGFVHLVALCIIAAKNAKNLIGKITKKLANQNRSTKSVSCR